MFNIIFCLISILFGYANNQADYNTKTLLEHKQTCIHTIFSDKNKLNDPHYQMKRAIDTINGDDADYIPKVPGAGEIFHDGETNFQLMHNGVKIVLNSYYDSQWLTDVIYGLKGHHEPQEEKCFYEVLKYIPPHATMIELGAYWAYYSLWFAFTIEGAQTYLIEPDPHRLMVGQKNFRLNNKSGFFYRGYVGNIVDRDPDIIGTQRLSIDDFLNQHNIDHVHILHADIQGSEYEMLQTTINSLHKIDYFFISTHGLKVHELCLNFLKTHGYSILAEHTETESCSGDGLIAAKRNDVHGPEKINIRKYQK